MLETCHLSISEFTESVGDNFDNVMNANFKEFKAIMHQRYRIPPQLVETYKNEICFPVLIDATLIQVAQPRVAWLEPMGYEINIDHATEAIDDLLK